MQIVNKTNEIKNICSLHIKIKIRIKFSKKKYQRNLCSEFIVKNDMFEGGEFVDAGG